MVVMVGQPGMGKSSLAANVARYLVGSGHWAEAYWVDMQGVTSTVTAAHQLAAALGLHGDMTDPARWVQGGQGSTQTRCAASSHAAAYAGVPALQLALPIAAMTALFPRDFV
jgi:hypothetical protein